MLFKIRQITRPRFAFRQKLATSGIIRVWTYEKVGQVIWLEFELNTCILDEYGIYKLVLPESSKNSTFVTKKKLPNIRY